MGGTGGGRWVHPKGANSIAVSGVCGRKALVCTRRAISVIHGLLFSATANWHFLGDLTASSLVGGCGYSHISA